MFCFLSLIHSPKILSFLQKLDLKNLMSCISKQKEKIKKNIKVVYLKASFAKNKFI